MKFILTIFTVIVSAFLSLAGNFTAISRNKPVTVDFVADSKTNVGFLLNIKSEKESRMDIFLRIRYIINADTLNDYLYLDETYSGMIKEIYLEPGDSVKAEIFLNNEETETIDHLKGSFTAKSGSGVDLQTTPEMNKFTGTIWKADQLPLFRISKTDERAKLLNLDFSLTENFEFDKLYVRIKVISPAQGILMFTKELSANAEENLPYRRRIITVDFPDLEYQKPGSYYIQIFHQMNADRVNGVDYIGYRITDK